MDSFTPMWFHYSHGSVTLTTISNCTRPWRPRPCTTLIYRSHLTLHKTARHLEIHYSCIFFYPVSFALQLRSNNCNILYCCPPPSTPPSTGTLQLDTNGGEIAGGVPWSVVCKLVHQQTTERRAAAAAADNTSTLNIQIYIFIGREKITTPKV